MKLRKRWTLQRSDRAVVGIVASLAVLVPIGWLWVSSLVPETYSVMDMGYPDFGGGPGDPGHTAHALAGTAVGQPGTVPVTELAGPTNGSADEAITLVARQERFTLATGETVDGYTLNHTSPGPLIRARQGDLVQVTLVNDSVDEGVALHWHGVDLPNAEDGVAGVTQDAVLPSERHVYRFIAEDPGTYWYHSHQVSHEQVRDGLFGTFVVDSAAPVRELDVIAAVHTYDGMPTVGGASGESRVPAPPGSAVRVRVINTDNSPLDAAVIGASYRVLAIDGRDVVAPSPVENRSIQVPAGGRADLGFDIPANWSAVRVQLGADVDTSLIVGPDDAPPLQPAHLEKKLDLLSYGSPAPLGFNTEDTDRQFEYSIGRRPGFLDGIPGLHWSINGHVYPDVPMFMVTEGDIVQMTIVNHSGEIHPMHLHGHHAVVLSRNGIRASGSPWWVDSLDVASGDTYEIAFVADNPGIWMDHCHQLTHATEGLVAHLAYAGIITPFQIGGPTHNEPE